MRRGAVLLAALVAMQVPAVLWAPIPAGAATLTVTTGADVLSDADGLCSLRGAIINANTNGTSGDDDCPAGGVTDTITLPARTYTLSIAGTGEDAAATGDLDLTADVTIAGAGQGTTVIDANGIDRVVDLVGGIEATLSGVTLREGDPGAASTGGGLDVGANTATLTDMTVRNSTAVFGGGISVSNFGELTATRVVAAANSAPDGAGILIGAGASAAINQSWLRDNDVIAGGSGYGGGLFVNSGSGTVTMDRSTISGNTSLRAAGMYAERNMTITNSTITGNRADENGGGVFGNTGSITLENVTVAGNAADADHDGTGSGGGILDGSGSVQISNTIVADNTQEVPGTPDSPDCFGTLDSTGYNLVEDANTACTIFEVQNGGTDIEGEDPMLSALSSLGGPTKTLGLLSGSPAIDAGNPLAPDGLAPECQTVDQRAVARPVDVAGATGTGCDIGAFEKQAPPTLAVGNASAVEPDSGSTPATFTVSLNHATPDPVTVNYVTANVTAVAGNDYVAKSGSLAFAAGTTSKTVPVSVKGDLLDEANETFRLNLSGPVNASILDGTGVATITDDDPRPSLDLDPVVRKLEGDNDSKRFVFTIKLSRASGRTVTVKFRTRDRSATSPDDFAAKKGTKTFLPGQTVRRVRVKVFGDTDVEARERFAVRIFDATHASISDGRARGVILNDD